jgi:phosphoribosyl 1,2-cyclic phosphate phosphodiesterase
MKTRVTILGCGPSPGLPMVGNQWGRCDPKNPRNRRLRPSLLIERNDKIFVVDSGPDFREQMLRAEVGRIDGVIFTHDHADHTQGIDDLRGYYIIDKKPVRIFGAAETLAAIRQRFGYMFGEAVREGYYDKPFVAAHEIAYGETLTEFATETFAQDHYVCTTLGLRFGKIAYSTDVLTLDEKAFAALEGIETWIVSAVRREPHVAHAHLALVLEWVERLKPKRTILTHMNASMDYEELRRELPPYVEPGYDGLVIEHD